VRAALGALMYLLLGAWSAGVTLGATALRTLLSGWLARHRHAAALGFVLLFALLTALSWQGGVSLLPACAVINTPWRCSTWATGRCALLASSAAWLGNDLLWQAWPAFIAEAVAVVLNLRTLRRLAA
jgi:hypothetical protein